MDNLLERNKVAGLWKLAFGDPDDFIGRFLQVAFREHFIYTEMVNDALASFLHLIPLTLSAGSKSYKGFYLFAVATDPAFRGQGHSRRLLRDSLAHTDADFVVTVPASSSLFDFYAGQGFTSVVCRTCNAVPSSGLPDDIGFLPASPDLLCKHYASAQGDGFRWSEAYLKFVLAEYEWMLFREGEAEYYCIFQTDGAKILIQDTDFDLNRIAGVFRLKGYDQSEIQVPVFGNTSHGEPFYAVRFLNAELRNAFPSDLKLTLAMDN